MPQTIKPLHASTILQALICLVLLLSIFSTDIYAVDTAERPENNPGLILVSIKPLYSLVAHLTEGVSTPVLLMKQPQSPHHYNMRPSERQLLSDARIIVWLGPQMESYLGKIIQQQKTAVVITALHADNLKLLSRRKNHSHDEHNNATAIKPEPHMIDPHVWLSTQNAATISQHIAETLITNDPVHAESYRNNLRLLLDKIEQTKYFITTTLNDNHQAFIAFHDAFQYFEEENGLNYIDSVNDNDEAGTSLKQVRQIKHHIEEENIQCLVYQDPRPALIDSLTKQTSIRTTALDPLGLNVKNDKSAWFDIMRQLAVNFSECLGP